MVSNVAEIAKPEEIDYEELASKVAEITKPEEIDYDQLAEKVAELTKTDETDYDQLAQRLAELTKSEEPDYEQLANRLSELIKTDEPDYEQLAQRIAELTKSEQLDYEQLAHRIAELTKTEAIDYEVLAQRVAELTKPETEPAKEEELAIAVAPKAVKETRPKPSGKKVVIPAPVEPELMTRLKRSFTAKLIESEEDVKDYYSEIKNAILGYAKTSSQVNWSNDRFTYDRETIAKVAIRGKTLCLYLALNPDEFPDTVYHQKFAGDTKMYEKTPMMVKVKSLVTLKRALRLVELLMEVNGAVKEEREKVDYAKMYAYRREKELLDEGLIKTAVVPKSDMDF